MNILLSEIIRSSGRETLVSFPPVLGSFLFKLVLPFSFHINKSLCFLQRRIHKSFLSPHRKACYLCVCFLLTLICDEFVIRKNPTLPCSVNQLKGSWEFTHVNMQQNGHIFFISAFYRNINRMITLSRFSRK